MRLRGYSLLTVSLLWEIIRGDAIAGGEVGDGRRGEQGFDGVG